MIAELRRNALAYRVPLRTVKYLSAVSAGYWLLVFVLRATSSS